MPEIEKQLPERGSTSVSEETTYSTETVVALQSLAHMQGLYSSFRKGVVEFLAFDQDDQLADDDTLELIQSVQSFDCFQLALVLWKESPLPTEEELRLAGLPRKRLPNGLTRRGLGDLLARSDELRCAMIERCIAPEPTEMFLRRAERLTKDLIALGLVEEHVEPPAIARANWKPLRGTLRLHQLMCHCGVLCSRFRHAEATSPTSTLSTLATSQP